MAGLASFLPRFVALPLVALLGTATLTFAADKQLSTPQAPEQPTASVPTVLVVPDVRRQAFVFAKGTLEDAGFAWKVKGSVQGYAANPVAEQYPAAGTRVVDTGSPVVEVTLATNGRYRQKGSPENTSPYDGSMLKIAGAAAAQPEPEAAPAARAPVAKPKPAAKPKPRAAKKAARPPAFVVHGAPREPLDEMPLPERARALGRYVASHRHTAAAANHFLYQHAWIVTGAKFGWWHGAQALKLLIAVDRRAQKAWGRGAKSEAVARAALARVQSKSR
jgi:hypothetical protein